MPLARVVTFEGVGQDRVEELRSRVEAEPPAGLDAKEMIVLHDAEGERAIAIILFETEEDYHSGDAILGAMPTGDTPGRRTSVQKYEVAIRVAR